MKTLIHSYKNNNNAKLLPPLEVVKLKERSHMMKARGSIEWDMYVKNTMLKVPAARFADHIKNSYTSSLDVASVCVGANTAIRSMLVAATLLT